MFPAPSPNTQAIFNLQSGGVTPSTADFQQSALRAAAQANQTKFPATSAPTSQPEAATAGMDRTNNFQQPQPAQQSRNQNDPFANHDVSNAANDLLSFATQNGNRNGQQFTMPSQSQQVNNGHMPVQPVTQENGRRNTKGSINSIPGSVDTGDFSESGQSDQQAKTNTRSTRAKKGGANNKASAGTKRKAEDTPQKSGRKAKANSGASMDIDGMDEDSEDDTSPKPEGEGGKKMTDEEKRKNFLERNRFVISPLGHVVCN
jgi:ATF/CREB family transcription factor